MKVPSRGCWRLANVAEIAQQRAPSDKTERRGDDRGHKIRNGTRECRAQ